MADITIGGKPIQLPDLNVKTMRRVLPIVTQMGQVNAVDGVKDPDALFELSLRALATWLVGVPKREPKLTKEELDALVDAKVEELDEEMMASEFSALGPAIQASLKEQGFFKPGEAAAMGGSATPKA